MREKTTVFAKIFTAVFSNVVETRLRFLSPLGRPVVINAGLAQRLPNTLEIEAAKNVG